MGRTIDKRKNVLLYPFQYAMGYVVHYTIMTIRPFVSSSLKTKLSQIENNKTLNNVLGLALFNALGSLLLMFTNVKIANSLGVALYGLYSYYLAIGEVGANFVRYGRNKSMTRDLIQMPEKFDGLVSNTLALGIINFVVFLALIILFRGQLDVEVSVTAFLLIMSPCINSLDFQSVYESLKEMSWHSFYNFIQRFIFLISVWSYIIIVGGLTLQYLAVALFLSWLLIVLIQYWEVVIGFCINVRRTFSWRSIWNLYKSNFVIALSCLTGVAFGPVIRMILNEYADSRDVGIYSAGMQIFLISQFLMHQVSRVGNPMMAEAGKADVTAIEKKSLCNKYFGIMLFTVIPFALPLMFIPQYVTDICFTEEYSELGSYLPLFSIYLIMLSLGIVYTQFLISMRKDKVYFAIYIGSAIATVLASLILIPRYSLLGAILALCIPHSIGCVFYYICSIKYLRV